MIITFLGHPTVRCKVRLFYRLYKLLEAELAEISGPIEFYFRGYGEFEHIAFKCCKKYKKKHKNVKLYFVAPNYTDESFKRTKLPKGYDELIYPPLEKMSVTRTILECDKWIIREAELIITCALMPWDTGSIYLSYAQTLKKRYIDLKPIKIVSE